MADRVQGVYTIRNTVTGAVYVGGSSDVDHRLRIHQQRLRQGRGINASLRRDWLAFGVESFAFALAEVVDAGSDGRALVEAEQRWIDWFRAQGVPLYNRHRAYATRMTDIGVAGRDVPDGFMHLNDARGVMRQGGAGDLDLHIRHRRIAVRRFPELGWGLWRFVAIADVEAFIAFARARRAA